ncbi:MAG: tripartite tricarboxylate transporter TctB family protein [Alphaproteobacteria bacterium]|nr:tripartite tricarboxylate transporter TctB family protein [Alphaproteobacteria bacterium]
MIHALRKYHRHEDLFCGIAMILFSVFIMWVARGYPVGNASEMGPGYFPRALCVIIAFFGGVLIIGDLLKTGPRDAPEERLKARPIITIAASYIVFGLTLNIVGLLPALVLLVVISAFAIPGRKFWEVVLLVVAMQAMALSMWYLVQISVPLIGKA